MERYLRALIGSGFRVEGWNPNWGLQVGPKNDSQKWTPKRNPKMGPNKEQKWDPKMGPKMGPKSGTQKLDLQMGTIQFTYKSFKGLQMGPKNGSPKWTQKWDPK